MPLAQFEGQLYDFYLPASRLLIDVETDLGPGSERQQRNRHRRDQVAARRGFLLEIYDYTCAACGLRLKLTSDLSLVEAAHLIPFSAGYNDKPNNGLALCPNHHWAMDRYLIAPCPDSKHPEGVWKVSPRLEDRRAGERELLELAGRPVLRPDEEKFYPAIESLRWREQHLVTKY